MARDLADLQLDLARAKARGEKDAIASIEQQIKLLGVPTSGNGDRILGSEKDNAAAGMNPYERWGAGIRAGFEEKKLGHRQALDAVTGGKNKQALEEEVKALNKLNKDLYDSGLVAKGGGLLGNMLVDVPEMFAGGKLMQAGGKLLPALFQTAAKNAPGVVKAAGSAAKNFGGGAFSGTTTPSENYDFVRQALQGGAASAPGWVGARTAQHAVNPFRNYGPPEGGWPKNSPEANLAQRLLEMEGMPGLLAENRVVHKGSGGIPGATNALSQVIVGGGGVRENRAKFRGALTKDQTRAAGIESETLGPEFGRALDERGTEQWNKLRTHPDVRLEGIAPELQKALDDVRATPQVAPSLDDITSSLDRAIHAASAKAKPTAPTRAPGIFGTLDEAFEGQPGHGGQAPVDWITQRESMNLPGQGSNTPAPKIVPTELWGETGPVPYSGNRSGVAEGGLPGFTPPGHSTGGPFTGSVRFHMPEEPPPPKLPSMTAEEFLRQHSEVSRRLRDASLPGGDANQRKLYRALLDSMDEAAEKSWTPDQINDYKRVRAEEGHQRDLEKMKRKSGDLIDPQVAMDVLSESQPPGIDLAPRLPLHRRTEAAAAQAPVPPTTENRAGMIGTMTGNPIVGGGIGGGLGHAFGGDMATGLGTVAGVVGIPAASRMMSHFLLGTEGGGRYLTGQNESRVGKAFQSKEFADFLERAGLSAANTIGQKYFDDSKENWYDRY